MDKNISVKNSSDALILNGRNGCNGCNGKMAFAFAARAAISIIFVAAIFALRLMLSTPTFFVRALTFPWVLIGFAVLLSAHAAVFWSTQKFFDNTDKKSDFSFLGKAVPLLGAILLLVGIFILPNIPATAGFYSGPVVTTVIHIILAVVSLLILWAGIDRRFTPAMTFEVTGISLGIALMLIGFLAVLGTYSGGKIMAEMLICGSVFVESLLVVAIARILKNLKNKGE